MTAEPDLSRIGMWLTCGHPIDNHCGCFLDRPKRLKDLQIYGPSGDYGKTGRVRRMRDDEGAAWPITGFLCAACEMPLIVCDSSQQSHPTCEPTKKEASVTAPRTTHAGPEPEAIRWH